MKCGSHRCGVVLTGALILQQRYSPGSAPPLPHAYEQQPPSDEERRSTLRSLALAASICAKELAGVHNRVSLRPRSVGSYLKEKLNKVGSDSCCCCDTCERQSRFHLEARCPAWAGQVWKIIGMQCERGGPLAPSIKILCAGQGVRPAFMTSLGAQGSDGWLR